MNNVYEDLKLKKELSIYIKNIKEDNKIIPLLFEIIETDKKSVKYQAEKVLRELSIEEPKLLYPYFERLIRLLNSNNNFIRLGVILSIPNLLEVDTCNKWMRINKKYLSILETDNVAEFGNVLKGIDKITKYHKEEEQYIIPILLNTNSHEFIHRDKVSQECNDVAIGLVIDCFNKIYNKSNYKKEILEFIRNNQYCNKESVRKKAKRFLRLYDRS